MIIHDPNLMRFGSIHLKITRHDHSLGSNKNPSNRPLASPADLIAAPPGLPDGLRRSLLRAYVWLDGRYLRIGARTHLGPGLPCFVRKKFDSSVYNNAPEGGRMRAKSMRPICRLPAHL